MLRLVCKPSSAEQDIMATLASLTKVHSSTTRMQSLPCQTDERGKDLFRDELSVSPRPTLRTLTIQQNIQTQAAEGLKAEGANSVQIEIIDCSATLAVPAGGAVDVMVLAMPFEAARTRSQIQVGRSEAYTDIHAYTHITHIHIHIHTFLLSP